METVTKVTHENFLRFAGGKEALLKAAEGFRPGIQEWYMKVVTTAQANAIESITKWHMGNLVRIFDMLKFNAQQSHIEVGGDEFNKELIGAVINGVKGHFDFICKPEEINNWLGANFAHPVDLFNDEVKAECSCRNLAVATVNGINQSRETVAKFLSAIGIVADDSGWPSDGKEKKRRGRKPKEDKVDEAGVPVPHVPVAQRGRKAKNAAAGIGALSISSGLLRELLDNGLTMDDLANITSIGKQTIKKAMDRPEGLSINTQISEALCTFLGKRVTALTANYNLVCQYHLTALV